MNSKAEVLFITLLTISFSLIYCKIKADGLPNTRQRMKSVSSLLHLITVTKAGWAGVCQNPLLGRAYTVIGQKNACYLMCTIMFRKIRFY